MFQFKGINFNREHLRRISPKVISKYAPQVATLLLEPLETTTVIIPPFHRPDTYCVNLEFAIEGYCYRPSLFHLDIPPDNLRRLEKHCLSIVHTSPTEAIIQWKHRSKTKHFYFGEFEPPILDYQYRQVGQTDPVVATSAALHNLSFGADGSTVPRQVNYTPEVFRAVCICLAHRVMLDMCTFKVRSTKEPLTIINEVNSMTTVISPVESIQEGIQLTIF